MLYVRLNESCYDKLCIYLNRFNFFPLFFWCIIIFFESFGCIFGNDSKDLVIKSLSQTAWNQYFWTLNKFHLKQKAISWKVLVLTACFWNWTVFQFFFHFHSDQWMNVINTDFVINSLCVHVILYYVLRIALDNQNTHLDCIPSNIFKFFWFSFVFEFIFSYIMFRKCAGEMRNRFWFKYHTHYIM